MSCCVFSKFNFSKSGASLKDKNPLFFYTPRLTHLMCLFFFVIGDNRKFDVNNSNGEIILTGNLVRDSLLVRILFCILNFGIMVMFTPVMQNKSNF